MVVVLYHLPNAHADREKAKLVSQLSDSFVSNAPPKSQKYSDDRNQFQREEIMTSKPLQYKIYTIPRSLDDPSQRSKIWKKMKAFRLNSLQLDPEAFASTYADEVRFADEVWDKRMANPLALHFVAVEAPSEEENAPVVDDIAAMIERDWLGMLVVIGPKEDGTAGLHASRSPWESVNSKASDDDGVAEGANPLPVYQLNGVFVMPKARGLGVGKRLAMATIEKSMESARHHGFKAIRMQVRVEADNEPAKKLYSNAGYAEVSTEIYTTKEKERNGAKLPPKTGTCIVMERLEEVN